MDDRAPRQDGRTRGDGARRPGTPRRRGVRLGRVLGIPVYLSASWLILAVLIVILYSDTVRASLPTLPEGLVYVVAFSFVVTLCLSVFLHELGHALTSRYYGIGVRGITLEMLGGYTEMEEEAPRPGIEAKVALAGPAVSAVLGAIGVALVIILPNGNLGHELAFQFAVSNIIVAIFNALPGLPLDGGRALRALVWTVRGDKHIATRVAGYTGRVVAAITLLGGLWLFYASGARSIISLLFTGMVAMVLWAGAGQAIRVGEVGGRIHLLTVAELIRPVTTVPTGTPLSEALRRAEETAAMGVLVVDSSDRPVALMHGHAARQVPLDRRPWVTVDAVSRDLEPGAALAPDMRGEQIINAIRARPSTEYVVMSDGEVRGVVVAADIARVLDPRTIRRPYPTSDNGAPS